MFNSEAQVVVSRDILPVTVPKPVWGTLTSFGYALTKLQAVIPTLIRYIGKQSALQDLMEWIQAVPATSSSESLVHGVFASEISMTQNRVEVRRAFMDKESVSHLAAEIQNGFGAWRNAQNAPGVAAVSTSHNGNSALWPALLRLRPLQEFWERELRRNHWKLLIDAFPDAWLFKDTPMIPQAVIPRLELSTWSQLAPLHDSGRSFEISPVAEDAPRWILQKAMKKSAWERAITDALTASALKPLVITERKPSPEAQTVIAFYNKSETRVELAGAYAFTHGESGLVHAAPVECA